MYDKIIESVNVKRTMSPNAWLWSLIADCKNQKDIELLFEALKSLRVFRLSNLRIHENFNCALCRDIAKACARVGALEFGKKTLWLHNVYGLSPSVASANHLLTYAKKNKDAKLMEEVMKLMKPNDLSLQSSTADLVFSFLFIGDTESLWKIEELRAGSMKQHTLATGLSCAKVLLGDVGAGKSSLVLRFVKEQFVEFQESTIGAAFFSQTLAANDATVKFEIWDTAGQERYHSLAPMYYRGAAAAIIVYDITNQASFERAKRWVQELQVQGSHRTI